MRILKYLIMGAACFMVAFITDPEAEIDVIFKYTIYFVGLTWLVKYLVKDAIEEYYEDLNGN